MTLFDPPRAVSHPAKWTPAILVALTQRLREWNLPIHDPFAGTGERLGKLCNWLSLPFTGTEIEAGFIVDPRVKQGDSTQADTYPAPPFCVVTSPTYGNGMNDHFQAKDDSRRNTYRWHLTQTVGYDQPLHENNSGRYALIRGGRKAAEEYWRVHREALRWWPDHVIVNVKNFTNEGQTFDLQMAWRDLLDEFGYAIVEVRAVPTPGNRNGANRDVREDHEWVIVAERS